jgi:hypothetical protein
MGAGLGPPGTFSLSGSALPYYKKVSLSVAKNDSVNKSGMTKDGYGWRLFRFLGITDTQDMNAPLAISAAT